MRGHGLVGALVLLLGIAPAAGAAEPGDVDTEFGDEGSVEIADFGAVYGPRVAVDGSGRVLVGAAGIEEPFPIAVGRLDKTASYFESYAVDDLEIDQLSGFAATHAGAVWIAGIEADSFASRVLRYNASGELTLTVPTDGPFLIPNSLAIAGGVGAVTGELGSETNRFAFTGVRRDGATYGDADSGWTSASGTDLTPIGNHVHLMPNGDVVAILGLLDQPNAWAVGVVTLNSGLEETGRSSTAPVRGTTASYRSQNDVFGRIVVALARTVSVGPGEAADVLDLMRFFPDGSLDPTFSGSVSIDVPDAFRGELAVTRRGEILLIAPDDAGLSVTRFDSRGERVGETTIDLGGELTQIDATTSFTSGRILVAGVTADRTAAVLALHGDDAGRFLDDDASVHEVSIEALAELGITTGCNPPYRTNFCPKKALTRAETATVLVRALGLPAAGTPSGFVDIAGSVHADNIDALFAAGITKGCNPPANDRFCPKSPINRGEMATMLVKGFEMTAPDGFEAGFTDTSFSVHAPNIDVLAANRVTVGCNPPDNDRFCPHAPVTRAQAASFIVRALST